MINRKLNELKFNFYGDFEQINYIYGDCGNDLYYVGNDKLDGAPMFSYFHNLGSMVDDVDKLNIYLRELKVRNLMKKDLTVDEISINTFFKFYIKSKKESLVRSIRTDLFSNYINRR